MAQPRPCQRCGKPHFNFQKCEVRENQKQGLSHWKMFPRLHDGEKVWGQETLDDYERRGELIVRKSGLRLRPHGGSLVEPKEHGD